MTTTTTYAPTVVIDKDGKFLQGARRFVTEIPDADEFGSFAAAMKAAKRTGERGCYVVTEYGLANEKHYPVDL